MITDGLGCASCAGTCGGGKDDSKIFDGIGSLGCDAGYTMQGGLCYANWDPRANPNYVAPTLAQWAAANPILAATLAPQPTTCPTGYEWDGLAGLAGCRPNAALLAAQQRAIDEAAAAKQQQILNQQILAQQQQAADAAAARQAAIQQARQCGPGYEWDGLDGLSGCRKIVTPSSAATATNYGPIDLGVQENWFTKASYFGLPNWQLIAGAGGLILAIKGMG